MFKEPSEEEKKKMEELRALIQQEPHTIETDNKAEGLAAELFITNEGRCNWANMDYFEKLADCKIKPLERDSFGWLVAGIFYKKEVFMYG